MNDDIDEALHSALDKSVKIIARGRKVISLDEFKNKKAKSKFVDPYKKEKEMLLREAEKLNW